MYALIVRKGVIQNPKMKGASTMDLIRVGRRRRKKELMRVSVIVFLVSFFIAAFLLYHSQMEKYERQRNVRLCGSWILEQSSFMTTSETLHPYVEKTGEVIGGVHVYFKDSGDMFENDTGLCMGSLPDNMSDIGRVRIFEGRMPEREGEIAITLGALERLELSYELGQELTVNYGKYYDHSELYSKNMNQQYGTKTYVVTGILYNYLDLWSSGSGMPDMVVTANELDSLDAQKLHLGFYNLKEEYADVDPGFARTLADDDASMEYNSKVYDAVLWDSGAANLWVLLSVMVIGCCAMAYIIIQENKRRQSAYSLMRCIGASKGQIRLYSMQESVLTIVPAAAAGVLASYIVCAVAVVFVSRSADIDYFFTFEADVLMQIVGAIAVTMVVTILTSQTTLRQRKLVHDEGKLGAHRADRLRKMIHRGKNGRRITPAYAAKRQNDVHPLRTALLRVIAIAVCSITLYNFTKIYFDISYYKGFKSEINDFTIDMPSSFSYQVDYEDKRTGSINSTSATFYDTDGGFTQTALKSIELVEGIKKLSYNARVSTHKLWWDGMEQSEYYKQKVEDVTSVSGTQDGHWQYDDMYGKLFTEIYCSDSTGVWSAFKKSGNIKWSGADYDKFESGEQVLVLFHSEDKDASLTEGKILHIPTASGDICVEVAAAASSFDVTDGSGIPYGNSDYLIYASQALGERVAAADGKEFRYTQAEFIFDNYRDAEFIAQQLSIIAVRNGGSYGARYVELKNQYKSVMHELFLYGGFVTALFFMFVVIRVGILKDDTVGLRASRVRLKQVGVDDDFLLRQAVSRAVKEGLSLLAAIPVVMVMYGFKYADDARKMYAGVSSHTAGYLTSRRLNRTLIVSSLNEDLKLIPIKILDLPYEWHLLIIVVIGLVFALVSAVMMRNELKSLKVKL